MRAIYEETQAIELLYKQHPDVSKAVQNFLRLANQGHTMKFYGPRGKRLPRVEKEWNESFAPRVNAISNAGLDGLIDGMHKTPILYGAVGTEIEITEDLSDVVDIHLVDPRWLQWEKAPGWRPYQYQNGKKVYVDSPNFSWVPLDPDIDDPRGNLMFAPVIFAIDTQLQTLLDVGAVIHKVGFPREEIKVIREPVLQLAREMGANSKEEVEAFCDSVLRAVASQYAALQVDSTYVHYDHTELNLTKSANERGGLDVRAVSELLDVFVLNGLQQMGVFQNRTSGITETWGTVQFKIFCGVVESLRRGSKRLVESNARIWARVRGYQAFPKFKHDPMDWEAEQTRWVVKTLEQTWNKMNQAMGWVTADEAAQNVVGHKAEGKPQGGADDDSDDQQDPQDSVQSQVLQMQIGKVLRSKAPRKERMIVSEPV